MADGLRRSRDVIAAGSTVCSAGVTHEEVRPLLAGYAAGTLDEAGCEAVRVHLSDGCVACLADVFDRPVGLPRTPASPPTPAPGPASAARARPGLRVVVMGLGLALVALGVRAVGELRRREAGTAARLSEFETQRGALSARVATLEHDVEAARRELGAARAEASGLAQAVQATAEADAEQRRRLEAIEARAARLARTLAARQREIDRLRTEADARGTLAALLGAPGLEVLPLAAVAPFREVRGHLLWRPTHDSVLLYASGLPRLPAGSTYQVRLAFDEESEQAGPSFRPDGGGALALAIPLGRAAERLRVVRVLLEPAAEPVLAGSRSRD